MVRGLRSPIHQQSCWKELQTTMQLYPRYPRTTRIVFDVRDGTKDWFTTESFAVELYNQGKLVKYSGMMGDTSCYGPNGNDAEIKRLIWESK